MRRWDQGNGNGRVSTEMCIKPFQTMLHNFRLDLDSAKEMIILVVEKEKSWMTFAKAWESK
jgi:hypothetical protein